MKIYSNHISSNEIYKKFYDLNHINMSVFVDYTPQNISELSEINFISLQEPNEYFGMHDWVIKNNKMFSAILTWSDKILNTCENSIFLPFGHTWFKKEQYEKNINKEFNVAHLRGRLYKTYGHTLRYELFDRQSEIKMKKTFYDVYGDRYNIEEARIGKEYVFGSSQFNIAIENTQHNGYFTEKIIDCFLLKSIPIYWGCSNIDEFFDINGIITFTSVDDVIRKINNLNENYYNQRLDCINKNYELALKYIDYIDNIKQKIVEILKNNNL